MFHARAVEMEEDEEEVKDLDKDNGLPSLIQTLVDGTTVAATIAEPEEFVEDFCGEKRRLRRNPKLRHKQLFRQKAASCMKRFCVYMLSYVGLTCTVVAYSILGGVVFLELERTNEGRVHDKAKDLLTSFSREIDTTRYQAVKDLRKFAEQQIQTLEEINARIIHLHENKTNLFGGIGILKSYMRKRLNETKEGALKFPLQAKYMGEIQPSKNTTDKVKDFQISTYNLVNKEGWSGDYDGAKDRWTFAGSLLYSVTVITTIGYGTITPKTTAGRAVTILYALIGIPLTVLCITNIGRAMASLFRALYGGTFCAECRQQFFRTMHHRRTDSIVMNDLDNDIDKVDLDFDTSVEVIEHKHADVPIVISLILVVWYIVFGATMFKIWEANWTIFEGAYFCFITLSTIGFGDFVPGFSHKDWDNQAKQVACSLYLLLGLSTLAMCFDLIQQRGTAIANKFGKFIGLVKDDES
ncbi:hypothetical protein ACF0H5_017544 [Mactra antiquata]